MKKTRYLLLAMLVAMCFVWTSSRPDGSRRFAMYAIAFYNVENLFDTLHDVRIDTVNGVPIKRYDLNDYEYLPDGANNWNSFRYSNKVKNMSDVLSKLATDKDGNISMLKDQTDVVWIARSFTILSSSS